MHIIKRSPYCLFVGSILFSFSDLTWAHEQHDHMISMPTHTPEQSRIQTNVPSNDHVHHHHQYDTQTQLDYVPHDHRREHGGQIYQATTLENVWIVDDFGYGTASSKLKTWVGTDENKLFIKAHVEKAESAKTQTEAMALYSRNIADFWDVQAGVAYQYQPQQQDQNQWRAVVGIHGLAPYFFETEAYLYIGQDQYWQLSLETNRDVLFTQKWIAQPYLNVDVVLSDQSKYAHQSGLSKLQTGIKLRYEITKIVMPFVDLAYTYHQGVQQTNWQEVSTSEKGGLYGVGITLKF